MQLEVSALQAYLESRCGGPVTIVTVSELGGSEQGRVALKQFGYGAPLLVEYESAGRRLREVLHRIRRTAFGRERDDDRAAAVWFDHQTFNHLPHHVPAVDMVAHFRDGTVRSLREADELMLVTSYRPGRVYAEDLLRLRDGAALTATDVARAETLAGYLAAIHSVRHEDPTLWRRRLRDLIGHGEGIMGLTDSYRTEFALADATALREWEEMANRWRWRLKPLQHRLCQVHGDFHPFNIVFDQGTDFHVLDRSRGEWGEAADDVSCLTVNYLFFSLQAGGRLTGSFRTLYDRFWSVYFDHRPDQEMLRAIQPWYAWRVLVLASPLWYPTITDHVRRKLLTFGRRVMAGDEFDYLDPNRYLEDEA